MRAVGEEKRTVIFVREKEKSLIKMESVIHSYAVPYLLLSEARSNYKSFPQQYPSPCAGSLSQRGEDGLDSLLPQAPTFPQLSKGEQANMGEKGFLSPFYSAPSQIDS